MNTWMADISLWRFPASLIMGAAYVLWVCALQRYSRKSAFYRLVSGGRAAVVLLVLAALALAIEGTWAVGLYHSWPFITLILLLGINLGCITLQRLSDRQWGFLLNHAGLFVILWGATFGAPDVTQARLVVPYDQAVHVAVTPQQTLVPLPFEIRLDRFDIQYYDDGRTPRQFRSELLIDGQPHTVEVNAPVRYGGYTIYQDSYDRREGAYTVLLLVRDPWLWVVWLGTAMLAAGSIILLLGKR